MSFVGIAAGVVVTVAVAIIRGVVGVCAYADGVVTFTGCVAVYGVVDIAGVVVVVCCVDIRINDDVGVVVYCVVY